jgi:Transposase IS66 family
MQSVPAAVSQVLQRGKKSRCRKTAGTCKELLGHEEWPWTFVDVEGVQPTNNAGERAERHGVRLRKTSGGTASASGSRFVERVLTGVDTCRRQGQKVLDDLSACIETWRHGQEPPSLVPDTSGSACASSVRHREGRTARFTRSSFTPALFCPLSHSLVGLLRERIQWCA